MSPFREPPRVELGPLEVGLEAAARRLTIPVMIVRGARSDVVSDAAIEDMKRLVPHATTCDVGAAGHMVAGDDNDVFTVNLTEFLAQLDPDRAGPGG